LKYFFSSSIDSEGSEAVSSRAIKDRIAQLIEEENPKKPLSDQKIADMLKNETFDIARRTVAKYREQMKILPAKFRRATWAWQRHFTPVVKRSCHDSIAASGVSLDQFLAILESAASERCESGTMEMLIAAGQE
jgi:hypothetical protein